VREAKVHTAWLKPDDKYEKACTDFIERILDVSSENGFLADLIAFQKKVSGFGIFNSLSQALLKITLPGVPDIYQGSELWDLSLVDPDNRRGVDFDKRQKYLRDIMEKEDAPEDLIKELSACPGDGRIKMFTIHRLLRARNEHIKLFEEGVYIPLEVTGRFAGNIIAFARKKDNDICISVAARFLSRLSKDGVLPPQGEAWQDTSISLPDDLPCRWENIFTAKTISGARSLLVSDILSEFPVGALFSERRGSPSGSK
jgi:(1->4)-alpha-D-glucan 1-alpha-D-glucosylmutase